MGDAKQLDLQVRTKYQRDSNSYDSRKDRLESENESLRKALEDTNKRVDRLSANMKDTKPGVIDYVIPSTIAGAAGGAIGANAPGFFLAQLVVLWLVLHHGLTMNILILSLGKKTMSGRRFLGDLTTTKTTSAQDWI